MKQLYNETYFAARGFAYFIFQARCSLGVYAARQQYGEFTTAATGATHVPPPQENFDRILNCVSHLLFLLTSVNSTNAEKERLVEYVRHIVRINPCNSNGETLPQLAANRDNTISSYFDEPLGIFFPFSPSLESFLTDS